MNADKLYEDFTNQILPKIQEWLEITKDYAFDLMDRYITYLIIIDWIAVWMCLLIIFTWLYMLIFGKTTDSWWVPITKIWGWVLLFIWLMFLFVPWWNTDSTSVLQDFILDLTVPEVRVYQELFK